MKAMPNTSELELLIIFWSFIEHITMNEQGSIPRVFNLEADTNTPHDLVGGGKHFDDVPWLGKCGVSDDTAHTKRCIHVESSHKRRPNFNQCHRE